jgi:hypothetical protein
MKLLKQHVPELIIGIFSIVTSLVTVLVRGNKDVLGYIVALIGCQLTITVFVLKSEMETKFERLSDFVNHRLELYSAFSRISYPGLRQRAAETIENAYEVVKKLAGGTIEDRADRIFHLLADAIDEARSEILAVHVVRTLADIGAWNRPPMSFYYKRMLEAVRRKVPIRRIFILFKTALDPHTGHLKPDVRTVLQQQKDDGIEVLVVSEDLFKDKSYIRDLAVIDRKLAEYSYGASDFVSNKPDDRIAYFTVDRREVKRYVETFKLLERSALELDKWLAEYEDDRLVNSVNPQEHILM